MESKYISASFHSQSNQKVLLPSRRSVKDATPLAIEIAEKDFTPRRHQCPKGMPKDNYIQMVHWYYNY